MMMLEWTDGIHPFAVGKTGIGYVLGDIYDNRGNLNPHMKSLSVQRPNGVEWESPCVGTVQKCKDVAQEVEDRAVALRDMED
jgi:hypothetical protein